MRTVWVFVGLCCLSLPLWAQFSEDRAGFTVSVKNEINPYSVLALFTLPGEVVDFQVDYDPLKSDFRIDAPSVVWQRKGHWRWRAPDAEGMVPVTLTREADGARMTFNVFVMHGRQRVQRGRLNGYKIGYYPQKAKNKMKIYQPPSGFVEVNAANADTLVSPHFRLGQFLCKQESAFPKYVTLRERLVLKLEYLLERLNEHGVRANSFVIMSGFRTPSYNRSLGNVSYSRHMWGDAADIYIDEDNDGIMDDINRDGRLNRKDADWLYDFVERLSAKSSHYMPFTGGLGSYGSTRYHGPFVHVDTRGFKARWGR